MTGESRELEAWLAERNAALRSLDIDWAKRQIGPQVRDDHQALMALHKARYDCTAIEPGLRKASGQWLKERGYTRLGGMPILEDLPE